MHELKRILQQLLGNCFPRFGTVAIRVIIANGEIDRITLEDMTISQIVKAKDLPEHVRPD